jgi:predicted PurR-regulated permease PerM
MAEYSKYVIPVLIVLSLVISIFIIKPFIIPLITGAIIAYTFHPVYNYVLKYLKYKTLSALVVSFLIVLLLSIPALIIVNTISREAYVLYVQGRELLVGGDIFEQCTSAICDTMRDWLNIAEVQRSIQLSLVTSTNYLRGKAAQFFLALPKKGLELFITFFAAFYLLRDGDSMIHSVKHLLATKGKKRKFIFQRFNDVMHGVIFGSLIIALVQGIVGGIGFAIFGVSSPLTWGVAMFFLALIPYVGTGLVWIPASLFLLLNGITMNQNGLIWRGIGLFLYGAFIISMIDNLIKPYLIGDHIRVHPLLVLVGIFGGLTFMGIPGIIVGPVILAMAVTLLEMYVHQHRLS